MIKSLIITVFLIANAASFAPNPALIHRKSLLSLQSSSTFDDAIARLQEEYKVLQEELLKDLVLKRDKAAAEEVAETMLEKAVDMAAMDRYKQEENLDAATKQLHQAEDDLARADALSREAHDDAVSAEYEANLVESVDAAYEDEERVRDMSVVHASHHLEEDAMDRKIEATFQELEAEIKQEEAEELLNQLRRNEAQLKESLKQLQELKREKIMEEWKKHEDEHEEFLRKARTFVEKVKDQLHLRSQEG